MALVTRPDGQPRGTQPPVLTTAERDAVISPGQGEMLVCVDPNTPVTTSQELQVFLAEQGDLTTGPNPDPAWQTVAVLTPSDPAALPNPVQGGLGIPRVDMSDINSGGVIPARLGLLVYSTVDIGVFVSNRLYVSVALNALAADWLIL